MLRVVLFSIGAHYLISALSDHAGSGWEPGRIFTLLLGSCLLAVALVLGLPRIIDRVEKTVGLEASSRYLVEASVWCFLSLLIIELILRLSIYNPPLRRDVTNWAGDLPAVHSVILWGREGYALTQYEKWGEIRTPHHDSNRENDVIVLGDSQTECLQVADDVKFTSVAETILRQDDRDLDLHNLGRSGLAMADYVSWIPPYRSLYRPKLIVIQLSEADFVESFHKDQFNYFVVDDQQKIELIHTFDLSGGFTQKARQRSDIFPQLEEMGFVRWYFMRAAVAATPPAGSAAERFAPDLAEQQMHLLIDAAQGTPLLVVLLPSAPTIAGDGIQMADPTHQHLKAFLKRFPEITIVDVLPEFQELASHGQLPHGFFNTPPGTGHLNRFGNEVVGRLLAKAIEELLP